MAGVRIYVEGGGDSNNAKREVRRGFAAFLTELAGAVPRIVACGGREQAHGDFLTAGRCSMCCAANRVDRR